MSALSNARWISLAQTVRIVSQLVSMAVLARLLPPKAYGLMAMATVVTNLAGLFRDMGTGAAVIQKKELSQATTSTVFWLNLIIGTIVALAMVLSSPVVALGFHEPELTAILCVLAVVFPVSSLGIVPQALLERESRFSVVARIEITSAFTALAAALIFAWQGWGVYSLVLQVPVYSTVSTVQLWFASRWRPALQWHAEEFRLILGFSANLSLFQFINYFSRNADSLIIGRLLGAAPLGVYSLAYRVMLYPLQNLTFVISRALFPVMSRQQDSPGEMANLYLKSVTFIAFITAPLMAGLWVLREPFVEVVFGPKWKEVASVLTWLAPVGFIQSIVSSTGTIFMATGRTHVMMKLGILGACLLVTSFLIGIQWGIEGLAACYLLANAMNAVPAVMLAGRTIGLRAKDFFKGIWLPIALAFAMALFLRWILSILPADGYGELLRLLALSFLGAVIYLLSARLLRMPQLVHLTSFVLLR